jgi:hypothetical protein
VAVLGSKGRGLRSRIKVILDRRPIRNPAIRSLKHLWAILKLRATIRRRIHLRAKAISLKVRASIRNNRDMRSRRLAMVRR